MKKTKDKISDVKIKKKFEKIREDKYNKMRDFFEKKLNYYNQSNDKYENVIDNSIDLYMEEINKLVIIYNKLFDNISKFIEEENCKKFEINDDLLKLNDKLKNDLNNEEILFKGFKKHPFLFIFGVLISIFLTALFLVLTPIGWVILAGFYEAFTEGYTFQKIISLIMILLYIMGILMLIDTMSNN